MQASPVFLRKPTIPDVLPNLPLPVSHFSMQLCNRNRFRPDQYPWGNKQNQWGETSSRHHTHTHNWLTLPTLLTEAAQWPQSNLTRTRCTSVCSRGSQTTSNEQIYSGEGKSVNPGLSTAMYSGLVKLLNHTEGLILIRRADLSGNSFKVVS